MIIIFTGIIEELGKVNRIDRGSNSFQIQIIAEKVITDLNIGDSIAVNGVCLTVVQYDKNKFLADVMPETMNKTTLKYLKIGEMVNLERALRLGDRLGGHLVQGHVDAIAVVVQKESLDIATIFRFKAPETVLKYTVAKGSIAIDGISLTVIDVFSDGFTVSLIPHTAHLTTLGFKKAGDMVNLESDIIGRYVERLLTAGGDRTDNDSSLSMGFLAENGFL